jgi:hypothetical protein
MALSVSAEELFTCYFGYFFASIFLCWWKWLFTTRQTNRHSHSSNKGSLNIAGTGGVVGLNHNFELLLTQIFCRSWDAEGGLRLAAPSGCG